MPTYDRSTYIVFLDIPVEIAAPIDALRAQINPAGLKRWIAHITLKQDADYQGDHQEILQRTHDFCSLLDPIPLHCTGLQFKEENDDVSWSIYVGIKERALLHAITKTLSKLLTPLTCLATSDLDGGMIWEQTDDYYPHITIVTGKNQALGKSTFDRLRQTHDFTQPMVCSSVTLARWNSTSWEKVHTIALDMRY